MYKIQKVLKKLNSSEKKRIKLILISLKNGKIKNLDLKKLKGQKDIYRIRKGKIRIIYKINKNKKINILSIERRSDTSYKL
ncbi:type II toxin-antitoxin system RelE/ParE family toxin [bacterium]|nr:type II toxin-antitoxin system RelE/ParE family toxin [bacterium]